MTSNQALNKGYRKLRAWELSNQLAHSIYNATLGFPKAEAFGLTSQMQRAALSVAANIVEGWARQSTKEKIQFCYIALGSLTEIEYFIDFAFDRKLYPENVYNKLTALQTETAKVLMGLIKSLKTTGNRSLATS